MAESFGIYMRSKAVICMCCSDLCSILTVVFVFSSSAKDFLGCSDQYLACFRSAKHACMVSQLIIIYAYILRLLYMPFRRDDRPQERVREKAYLSFCTLW